MYAQALTSSHTAGNHVYDIDPSDVGIGFGPRSELISQPWDNLTSVTEK